MEYYSPGKLMLTGEYVVLNGAKSLALPTRFGQFLKAESMGNDIQWKAFDSSGQKWFSCQISWRDWKVLQTTSEEVAETLVGLLKFCLNDNTELRRGWKFTNRLTFDRQWGLGSSSTLIANLARWSGVNAHELLRASYPGSGYDVAVAIEESAVLFALDPDQSPVYQKVIWKPGFAKSIFFVYLGEKQDSRKEIEALIGKVPDDRLIKRINEISESVLTTNDLTIFSALITEHEKLLSDFLGRKMVKSDRFPDYSMAIKSLGAWGGDFVLATGDIGHQEYFKQKGYGTILSFDEMISA